MAAQPWKSDPEAFLISIEADPDLIDIGNGPLGVSFITNRAIEDLPSVPEMSDRTDCVGRSAWAAGIDAVEATTSFALVTVEATTDQLVRVTGIRLVVDERRAPPTGIHLTCAGKGEQNEIRTIRGDLDSDPPTSSLEESGAFNFDVSRSDSEVLLLSATTLTCDCLWHAELQIRVAGESRIARIPETGSYRTASTSNTAEFIWRAGDWERTQPAAIAPLPAAVDTACLLSDEIASQTYNADFKKTPGVPQSSSLGETPVVITTCSYDLIDPPASGEYTPLAITLFETQSAEDAAAALAFFEDQINEAPEELEPGKPTAR